MRLPPVPLVPRPRDADYGAFRRWQGPRGTWHWGVDLPAPIGAPVVAPEDMAVIATWSNDATPPFSGYGPGGVLGRGASGRYHLLAHLAPVASPATSYRAGERIGSVGTPAHVHWEVRARPIDSPTTRRRNTIPPLRWLAGERNGVAPALLLLLLLLMR